MDLNIASSGCPFHGQLNTTPTLISSIEEKIFNLSLLGGLLHIELSTYQDYLLKFHTWVLNFLSNPNSELGRKGSVCPWTRKSYDMDHFWVNIQPAWRLSIGEIREVILKFKEIFLGFNSKNQNERLFSTIVVLFPNLDPQYYEVVNDIQQDLKSEFVTEGLMIGQFYPGCDQPGLHNEAFRPLSSPIPLLAIRNMVESDWPFLKDNPDHAKAYSRLFALPTI